MNTSSKLQLLYEYDKDFFSYVERNKDMWNDLVYDAMKKFKIRFDLENNDTMKQQRSIEIPQDEWEFTKCKFNCEMYQAGGDWQIPVLYFRCQLISGYCYSISKYRTKYSNSHFVYIPGKEEGNYQLVPGSKEGWAAPDNNSYKKGIDPEANERDCWKSLQKYLKLLVDLEVNRVRSERQEREKKI